MQQSHPRSILRYLTAGGCLMMLCHACYQTFYVAYLVEGVGLDLVTAGMLFAALQTAGALSRIGMGWLVDRFGTARRTLVSIALLGAVATLVTAMLSADWSLLVLSGASVMAGIGSSGWYGVFLAEIARRGEGHQVGHTTGGALFFIYWATALGPLMMSFVVGVSGSYAPALWLIAGFCAAAAVTFHRTVPAEV